MNKNTIISICLLLFFIFILFGCEKHTLIADDKTESPSWEYINDEQDSGDTVKIASIKSLNTQEFSDKTHKKLKLSIRNFPTLYHKRNKSVIISINNAVFKSDTGTPVFVQFDDEKPIAFIENNDDYLNTSIANTMIKLAKKDSVHILYIDNYNLFVSKLEKAKKVEIKVKFYKQGDKIFTFNTDKLSL